MPIDEYRCDQCGTISEFLAGVGPKGRSPKCKQLWKPAVRKGVLSVLFGKE